MNLIKFSMELARLSVQRRCVDITRIIIVLGLHVGSYDYANSWAGEGGRLF